ncbi:protein phosphatase 1 regulatory subunit 12A isoform X5 [Tachysurus ichikawai]
MVTFLVEHGACINQPDNEGWIPLHAAASCGYLDIAEYLISAGANVGVVNSEGETPLDIAEEEPMEELLKNEINRQGVDIEAARKEEERIMLRDARQWLNSGQINDVRHTKYLISAGANVGVVNSEGETPLDIAEEEPMEELLKNEINRQGVDIEAARKEEERIMLRDARQWLNSGQINDVRHTKSGGTALHVAAAKGYAEVLKLLIQAGYDVNIKDYDGWTPLHAAAHWGKDEACRILVENLCDMDLVNKVGQTAFDVADEDVVGYLEELQKKQNLLSEKKDAKKSPLIETTTTADNNQSTKPAVKSKETLLLEVEKNAPHIENLESEKTDEELEGKKDESSCSSEEEEEDDSESENEADKTKSAAPVSNSTSSVPAPVSTSSNTPTTPTSPVKKVSVPTGKVSPKEEERKDESPASWRLGLRKTGSYGALAEISATKEAQKEKDLSGVMRSASSPRLTSSLDNKDKEKEKEKSLAYVAPTFPRRHPSASDIDEKENRCV